MNRNFAKPKADMTPEFGPDALIVDGRTILAPKAAHYARAGYLPLSPDWPVDPPEGKHYERTDKIEPNGDDGYKWVYTLVDNPPPPPRRWSRLSVKCALADAHLLPAAQSYLTELLVKPDYPAWAALSDCDYIEEGFGGAEAWNALLDGAANALGKTRAEIDAFLDAIPTEG